MQDEKIFKITLITTILGLICLFITSGFVNPEVLPINQIDNSKIDNQIQVNGIIEKCIITKTNTIILQITDKSGSINVVIFPTTDLNMTLHEGMNVTVVAKVTQYHGDLELILEKSRNIQINS